MTCAMFSSLCPRLFAKNGRHADDIPRHSSMYVQTDALKTDFEISVRSMVAVMTARKAGQFNSQIFACRFHANKACSQKSFSSACLTTNIPSLDGACGASKGFTCAGGPYNGQCCSAGGFCGSMDVHCKTGW
jgi:hypothetical protein